MNTENVLYPSSPVLQHFLPFGLHPRAIFWNLRSFSWSFLWPVWIVTCAAFFTLFRDLKRPFFVLASLRSYPFFWLSLWTVVSLLAVYGSGIYQDHIQAGAVTVGNSFLRYLLPLGPLMGVMIAYLFERYQAIPVIRRALYAFLFVYCVFGVFAITVKDDEGVMSTRVELMRYQAIHVQADHLFPLGSIILSDRSDKIFGPDLRSISPLPQLSEIVRLMRGVDLSTQVGIFARPFSQRDRDEFRAAGIQVLDLGNFGREHLSRLILL